MASPIALIFKQACAVVNKYAPRWKCVADDYNNLVLMTKDKICAQQIKKNNMSHRFFLKL